VAADEGYFGERVAAVYDEHAASMFDPAVVGPAVEMLAELAGDGAALWYYLYDTVTQRLSGQHYYFADGQVPASPTEMRYAWPAELDLMARLPRMRLQDRWGGWVASRSRR
jgi:hypothetical protein